MNRRSWLVAALLSLPLAVAGAVYATTQAGGYTCPINGEQLPCQSCCPLNQEGYACPLTGEQLPCEQCCPLNNAEQQ